MAASTWGKNVLLGFKDEDIKQEITTWTVNKIGGMPDKLPGLESCTFETKCHICGRITPLVVQLYCPLGDSAQHRNLYVFCCINEQCWNKPESWKVLRCQFLEPQSSDTSIQCGPSEPANPWLMEEDNWDDQKSEENSCNNGEEQIVDEAMHMTLSSDRQPNHEAVVCSALAQKDETCSMVVAESPPKCLELPSFLLTAGRALLPENIEPKFCTFYINVFEETESKCAPTEHVQALMESYYQRDGNPFYSLHTSSSKTAMEGYEKTEVKHGDRTFHKFLKQVAHHPQQIIRYCWKGDALHMTQKPPSSATDPPLCQYCGNKRVFELQLMPALVHSLKLQDIPTHDTPVEFGSVIVNTCEKSCWNDGDNYKLEHIALEVDPDDLLFRRANIQPVLEIKQM